MLASFWRKFLSLFLMTAIVILASFSLCPSPFASSAASLAVVAPYDTIEKGQGNWGLNAAGAREFLTIGNQYRVRQDGTVRRLRFYVDSTDGLTGLYVEVWRKKGERYCLIGSSENICVDLSSNQINTVDLADPIANVCEGDYYGCRIEKSGGTALIFCAKAGEGYDSPGTYYVDDIEPSTEDFPWEAQAHDDTTVPIELYMDSPDYVFIGNSIISGAPAHCGFILGWPATDIESTIERQFANISHCTYQNMGLPGDNLPGICRRIEQDVVELHPRVVIIEGGLNDIAHGPDITKDQFLAYWESILDQAISAGIKVVVIPILPWSAGSNDLMRIRDDWNKSLTELVSEHLNSDLVDASGYVGKYRLGGPEGNSWDIQDECNADGTHFTAEGHRRIARAIYDRIQCGPPSIESVSFAEISAGDTVTIRGKHFRPTRVASRVLFEGREASGYVSWSDSEARVRVPKEMTPGTTRVTVETLWGSSEPFQFSHYVYYLAEGCTREGFAEWLCLQNPGTKPDSIHAKYLLFNGAPIERTYTVSPTSRLSINVNGEVGSGQDVSVVLWSEREFYAERPMYFDYKQGQEGYGWSGSSCVTGAPSTRTDWYFAEGCTREGFEEWVCIQNPNDEPVEVVVYYIVGGAQIWQKKHYVPAESRKSVFVNGDVGPNQDVSMYVHCDSLIVAERPMYFNYHGKWTGGHVIIGTGSPKTKWYFAEGSTQPGFEEWLAVQNANTKNATITCRFLRSDGTQENKSYMVGAHSRWTLDVSRAVGVGVDSAIVVESSIPVVAERPMYFSYKEDTPGYAWTGGHDVVGAPAPKTGWFFAEGCTYNWADEYICVANPGAESAHVTFSFMMESGNPVPHSVDIAPHKRATVKAADIVGRGHDVSAKIASDKPVVAERPMYFNYNGWTGGHDVVGF